MTLKEFIDIIKEERKTRRAREKICADLCEALGAITLTPETVKKWVYNMRTPDPDQFFQQGISISGFTNYFKEKTLFSWKDWQKAFCTLDSDTGIINCTTIDEEIFYLSLLKQFCFLIRLNLPKEPASVRHILPPKPGLIIGRSDSLNDVAEVLSKNNYAILTGFGGIGKSAVALAYAHNLNECGGWIIQHIICEETSCLRDAIAWLQFDGFEDDGAGKEVNLDRRINALQASKRSVLIIFDNLNQPFSPDDRMAFQELLKCNHVHFLITSRRSLVSNKQHVIEIGSLDDDALLEFYAYHRFTKPGNHSGYIKEHYEVLKEMFDLVGNHTLMIELLAKLPMRIALDEYEINKYVSDTLNISGVKVSLTKDNKDVEDSIKGIIKGIFSISQLNDSEKNVMRHMTLMPLCGIELKLFIELTGCDRRTIIRLKDSHWIRMDEETLKIRLHPLIYETVLNVSEIKPSEEICHAFLTNLQEKLDRSESRSPTWYQYKKIMLSTRRGLLFSLFPISSLKEEYRSTLLLLDREVKRYMEDSLS